MMFVGLDTTAKLNFHAEPQPASLLDGLGLASMLLGVRSAFLLQNQCHTLILFWELFRLTCNIRLQPLSMKKMLARCTIAFLVGSITLIGDCLILALLRKAGFTIGSWVGVSPLVDLLIVAATLCDVLLVIRILRALRKNDEFCSQFQNQRNGALDFLLGLIVLMMCCQIMKFVAQLVKEAFLIVFYSQSYHCETNESVLRILNDTFGLANSSLANNKPNDQRGKMCNHFTKNDLSNIHTYFRESWLYASEFVGFCIIVIWKKIHSGQTCGNRRV